MYRSEVLLTVLIMVIICTLNLSGCAQTTELMEPVNLEYGSQDKKKPSSDESIVILYRTWGLSGGALNAEITTKNQPKVVLPNSSYYQQIVPPGRRQYVLVWSSFEPEIVRVDCKPGSVHFIKFDFAAFGGITFKEVSEKVGREHIKGMRRVVDK